MGGPPAPDRTADPKSCSGGGRVPAGWKYACGVTQCARGHREFPAPGNANQEIAADAGDSAVAHLKMVAGELGRELTSGESVFRRVIKETLIGGMRQSDRRDLLEEQLAPGSRTRTISVRVARQSGMRWMMPKVSTRFINMAGDVLTATTALPRLSGLNPGVVSPGPGTASLDLRQL